MAAVRELLPPQPPAAKVSVPLSAPGRVETLLAEAGLTPWAAGDVECHFEFEELETALGGLMSAGVAVAVVQRVGAEPVRRVITESLAAFRTDAGRYHLQNRFRYVVASA
jgi:hypothetical protein